MSDPSPKGVVIPVRVEAIRTHSVAVYANVICRDEDGVEWFFQTSSFNFDLKPYQSKERIENGLA